jgi:uncharacterized protein YecE (DUF72 family)
MKWRVGTSSWSNIIWRGVFYPPKMPAREWLSFYAQHLDAVEINNSFYRLPKPEQFVAWEKLVPRHFTFAVKASRYITHRKRLKEPEKGVPRLIEALALRLKKGPVIFQLPPRFPKDTERLAHFLNALPKDKQRFAMEFRNTRWHHEDVYDLLRQHCVAFCMFEKGKLFSPRIVTAPFVYLRLHGREENYKGSYSREALQDWYGWLKAQQRDVYIFFDNTAQKIYSLENAKMFKEMTESDT